MNFHNITFLYTIFISTPFDIYKTTIVHMKPRSLGVAQHTHNANLSSL